LMLETHGEVCRLGYLRLIVGAAKSGARGEPISPGFITAILEGSVKKLDQGALAQPNTVGLIRSSVAARNYVSFAIDVGLLDRHSRGLGENGIIYAFTRSISPFEAFLRGDARLTLLDTITLRPVDRIYFTWLLLTHDYLILPGIIKWALEVESFARLDAMNYVMEDLYPQALAALLAASGRREQRSIQSKIEAARRFREERMKYKAKAHWIRSSLYAKYRHVVPPRLEWLVDLGLLNRVGRGRYIVSEHVLSRREDLLRAVSYPPSKLRDGVFANIAPLMMPYTSRPSREAINRELVQTFNVISSWLSGPVKVSTLELAVAIRLLENNQITTPSMVRDAINQLSILYPDKLFLTLGPDESLYLTRINLGPREITQ